VHDFRLEHPRASFRPLAIAAYAAAVLLVFTLPVRCRVETTRRQACGQWAYGTLFGCGKVPGHRLAKFYARLGWQRAAVKAVAPSRRDSGDQRASQYPQAITVTVADSALAKCGFWVGVVGTAAGVVGVIIPIAGIR
jgi:hypothetical protein